MIKATVSINGGLRAEFSMRTHDIVEATLWMEENCPMYETMDLVVYEDSEGNQITKIERSLSND